MKFCFYESAFVMNCTWMVSVVTEDASHTRFMYCKGSLKFPWPFLLIADEHVSDVVMFWPASIVV